MVPSSQKNRFLNGIASAVKIPRSTQPTHELVRQEDDYSQEDSSVVSGSSSVSVTMMTSSSASSNTASLSTSPKATPFVEAGVDGCCVSSNADSSPAQDGSFSYPPLPPSLSDYNPSAVRHSKLSELIQSACNHLRSKYKILIAGQILSFCLSVTGAAQATLYFDCNLSAPTFTVGFFYFGLVFCLIPVYRQGKKQLLQAKGELTGASSSSTSSSSMINNSNNNNNRSNRDTKRGLHTVLSQQDSFNDSVDLEEDFRQEGGVGVSAATKTKQEDMFEEDNGTAKEAGPPQYTFLYLIPLHAPAWRYIPMAILDVYANYFTVLAFSYTNITSVTLFDALAIPTAMVVSTVFLSRRYTRLHLLGVLACSMGILMNVLQDYEADLKDDTGGDNTSSSSTSAAGTDDSSPGQPYFPHKLRGDLFALLGGILFGINNTVGEVAVRSLGGPNEYLGMLGIFATIICAVQSLIFERDDIAEFFNSSGDKSSTCSEATAWWVLAAYACSAIFCYLGASRFLQVSEAAFYNLSLLTGDLWSVAFSVVAQHIVPQPLFFAALAFILSGVVLYEMAPSPILMEHEQDDSFPEQLKKQQGRRRRRVCPPCVNNPDDEDDDGNNGRDQTIMSNNNKPRKTKLTTAELCWNRHANPQELYFDEDEECDLELRMA